jgi:hypothetical protein
MLANLLLTAVVWPLSVTQYCQPSDKTFMTGVAQSPTGNFLYCEQVEQTSEHSLRVSYLRDNKAFAEKIIGYVSNPETPSIQQKDFRSGELRQAKVTEQTIDLQYQPSAHKKNVSLSIPLKDVDVIDAGFDNFVRNNWKQLQAGKTLPVNFASMPHLKVLPLRITSQPSVKCASKTESLNESFCFLVEIDNAVLRLLLGNIKLTYDQQHRLVTFNGVVNIEDEKESTQTAKISYYYQIDYLEK